MIATQQIGGNDSGPFLRTPKIVVMHSTRSTQSHFTDSQELGATLNWFVNPDGASSHWVLSEVERVRVVSDALIAWHSTYLNSRSWGIEMTQPTIDRDFTNGHYANAALIGQNYVSLGVAPVWLDYWDGDVSASGFVAHEDTKQGRESGKSDPGPKFDRARFISSLEDDMDEAAVKALIAKHVDASNSKARFKQIADNLPELNAHLTNVVNALIAKHANDAAKHSAGEGHSHAIPVGQTEEA